MKVYEFRVTYDDDYIEIEAENEEEAWELVNDEVDMLCHEPNIELRNPDTDDYS